MKKKLLCTLALSLLVVSGFSQTRRIALHSHSGSDASATTDAADNFGISPYMAAQRDSARNAKKQQRDSIKIANYRDSLNETRAKQRESKKK